MEILQGKREIDGNPRYAQRLRIWAGDVTHMVGIRGGDSIYIFLDSISFHAIPFHDASGAHAGVILVFFSLIIFLFLPRLLAVPTA